MKIALFHNLPMGGARRVVGEQIFYLSQRYDVRVFELNPQLKSSRLKRDFDNLVGLSGKHKRLARKIDESGFDVVLAHPDRLTQAPFILRHLKTPSVYFCEELLRIAYEPELGYSGPPLNEAYETLNRKIRKRADKKNAESAGKILVASGYIRKKVEDAYSRESLVCPLGVDTKVFKPSGKKREKQLIFVGEETNFNGYPLAKKVAEIAGLRLKVITGFKLSDAQLAEEYSKSTAALCLSRNEPFGLVALEAMSCETPVLAVNEGGHRETVVDGKTGYLLPRNPEAFVEKLGSLPRHMGKKGREHVKKNFTWEKHGKILEECLKSLLQ